MIWSGMCHTFSLMLQVQKFSRSKLILGLCVSDQKLQLYGKYECVLGYDFFRQPDVVKS